MAGKRKPTYEELEQRIEQLKSGAAPASAASGPDLYSKLAEAEQDAIYIMRRDFTIEHVNGWAAARLGLSADSIIGKHVREVFQDESLRACLEIVARVLESRGPVRDEYRMNFPDGSSRTLDVIFVPIEENGEIKRILVVSRDITEKKNAEEFLRRNETRYRILAEFAQDAIFIFDRNATFQYLNKYGAMQTGVSSEDVIGKNVSDVFSVDMAEMMKLDVENVFRTGAPLAKEHSLEFPDGVSRWVNIHLVPLTGSGGAIEQIMGISRDVTEVKNMMDALRKSAAELESRVQARTVELAEANEKLKKDIEERRRAEQALRETEKRFAMLFESTPDGILLAEARTGRFRYANPAMCRMVGYSLEEILEMKSGDLTPADHRGKARSDFELTHGKREMFVTEHPLRRKDGTLIYVDINSTQAIIDGTEIVIGFFRDVTQRWAAENSMRASEERYRTLAEAAQDFIFIVNRQGIVEYVNSFGATQFNTRPEDIIGSSLEKLFPAANFTHQMVNITKVLDTGKAVYVENKTRFPGGEAWLSAHLVPIKDKEGRIKSVLGISRDITQKKRAEEMLMDHSAFQSVLAAIRGAQPGDPEELLIKTFLYAVLRGYGLRMALYGELDGGKICFSLIAGPLEEVFRKYLASANPVVLTGNLALGAALISGKPHAAQDILNDEHYDPWKQAAGKNNLRSCLGLPLKIDGAVVGGMIVFYDQPFAFPPDRINALNALVKEAGNIISERRRRKKAEEALIHSEERFRRFAENSPDIIMRWLPPAGTDYINPAVEKITGYTPGEILGNSGLLVQRIHPDNILEFTRVLTDCLQKSKKIGQVEGRFFKKDGNIIWFEARIIPIVDEKTGNLISAKVIIRDITDRKRMEEENSAIQQQLLQSQKMEALGTLAGGMAHDFNNMLAVIMGTAELGLRKIDDDDTSTSRFKKILKVTERARDLSMKLLTFARKEKLNIRTVSVKSVIDDLTDMLKRSISKKIKIQTLISEDACNLSVDVNQIHQALLNICINAGEAMRDGGTLRIEALAAEEASGGGTQCAIRIADTGEGMPGEIIGKIFDPFFTTKESGTGLGLSITMGIIKNHGGNIKVESRAGEGTSMTVFLPGTHESPQIEMNGMGLLKRGVGTILIVDDRRDFLEMASEALKLAGYKPLTASSGREAVRLYTEKAREIDLVILDMLMPEMDGYELFNELRKIDPEARIVLCSGYSMDGKAGELIARGAIGFVQKPFGITELLDALSKADED